MIINEKQIQNKKQHSKKKHPTPNNHFLFFLGRMEKENIKTSIER